MNHRTRDHPSLTMPFSLVDCPKGPRANLLANVDLPIFNFPSTSLRLGEHGKTLHVTVNNTQEYNNKVDNNSKQYIGI